MIRRFFVQTVRHPSDIFGRFLTVSKIDWRKILLVNHQCDIFRILFVVINELKITSN